ncbi:MAG: efflux RND transporter periplasmic adaptor subunit [Ignavibacteria bacterium]|jgi:Cu(I)/Ag(I) efflux system membrane fusion protein
MNNKKIIILIIILLAVIGLGYGGYRLFFSNNGEITQAEVYTCPMHPQIISDHPGQCPICGMDLVIKKVSNIAPQEQQNQQPQGDLMEVKLSPSQQVLANVQTAKVVSKQFSGEKNFNGYVKIDEKNFANIATPVSGKIIKMYVDFEGQVVSKGQAVAEIYSPELVSTQKEYLLALNNYERVSKSGNQLAIDQAKEMLEASKNRLTYWEFTDNQFEELERTGTVKNSITIYSKYSGIVTKKYALPGHWTMAGENLLDVADLSTVWVIANIYESDIQYIKSGQTAQILSSSYPNEEMYAKINYVNPVINPDTRTLEVRIDVANRGYKLKPDMYVKVKINTYVSNSLAVPKNAVIRNGDRDIVYVEKEKGVYVPREVTIGYEQDGYYAVTSGLKEGETVVSSGGFLIDSETQIQMGMQSGHEGHVMTSNNDDKMKINPDQDIMKDMQTKK